ncbi:AtpZ/AtpI family protein [Acidicapsa ligni]|uniref:AtpZ/AtpI family protein n=1 Tax=Acidicapsa ligni TaxID=542300 RepID=UPI0021E0FC1F|nr:AtpZ/AtpI family protein [Acidicapsa ligni]
MPFHSPMPEDKTRAGSGSEPSGLQSLVQAEKLIQIAILLPCATLIGWGIGWWIDSRLHTHWVGIAGLVFGMISGMVSVIRLAMAAGDHPRRGQKSPKQKSQEQKSEEQ